MAPADMSELKRLSQLPADELQAQILDVYKYNGDFYNFANNKHNGQEAFDIIYGLCKVEDLRKIYINFISTALKDAEVARKHHNLDRVFELARQDISALNVFAALGDLGDYPIETKLDFIFEIVFDENNPSAGIFVMSMPKLANKFPERFKPRINDFWGMLGDITTASMGYMVLVELATSDPKAVARPNMLQELEKYSAAVPQMAYYLYQLVGKACRASEQLCVQALDWLQNRFAKESGQNAMYPLMAMREVSGEYRTALAPHVSFLQGVQKNATLATTCHEYAEQILDFYFERSLEKVESKVDAMGEIWAKLGLQADDPLIKAVTDTVNVKDFDIMISYNWSHKDKVIRIRDALLQYGVSIWMDVEQMSGNIYGKMAEAVLGCKVIIPCMTAAYEASQNCKRELGYAADKRRKIVPIRLEMIDFTWSGLITAGAIYTVMTDKEFATTAAFDAAIGSVVNELSAALGRPLVKGSQASIVTLQSEGGASSHAPAPAPAAAPAKPAAPAPAVAPAPAPASASAVAAAGVSATDFANLQKSHAELQKTVEALLSRVGTLEQQVKDLSAGGTSAASASSSSAATGKSAASWTTPAATSATPATPPAAAAPAPKSRFTPFRR